MGAIKGSNVSSDPQKWHNVFNVLVGISQTQQIQIESLAKERKLLENVIKSQHESRVSECNMLRDQISQMKRDASIQEMARNVDMAKLDLVLGQKHRETFSYKIKLDDAIDELADFRGWFDYLSSKCSETTENNSKMVALLSERNFVWNQFKKRESDLMDRLKSKSSEVEQANEKIQKLLSSVEILQLSKLKLKTNLAELEAASVKKSEEISRLSRELELLRKARSDSVTPALRRCSATSPLGDKNGRAAARNIIPKEESRSSQARGKGCTSLKRKAVENIPSSATPKLFTAAFKVPKLKSPSPRVL
ncbi:uncharacterized protein LOC130758336 [Actinidia eriantha]|uniref:uncharacterized protein LOC130758336 n=1 Tax=Actinidia eriantha TaxID=165200 RepID=UPI00258CC5EE|nr:uncharacterized protein LOC130758336 [Actinidia eriantha]